MEFFREIQMGKFPMSPHLTEKYQKKDKTIKQIQIQNITGGNNKYELQNLEGADVLTKGGKVVIPKPQQGRIVAWYHKYLAHPGRTRMEATIRQAFEWKGLREQVHHY